MSLNNIEVSYHENVSKPGETPEYTEINSDQLRQRILDEYSHNLGPGAIYMYLVSTFEATGSIENAFEKSDITMNLNLFLSLSTWIQKSLKENYNLVCPQIDESLQTEIDKINAFMLTLKQKLIEINENKKYTSKDAHDIFDFIVKEGEPLELLRIKKYPLLF